TAFLPATFAAAGLVSLFVAVVAARQLYGLIGPEAALIGLIAVAASGVLLGWFHGPFLTAFGLTGAALAPFLVGGGPGGGEWFCAWFVVIAAAGLVIDAVRRGAWISVLALGLGYGGLAVLAVALPGPGWVALA